MNARAAVTAMISIFIHISTAARPVHAQARRCALALVVRGSYRAPRSFT